MNDLMDTDKVICFLGPLQTSLNRVKPLSQHLACLPYCRNEHVKQRSAVAPPSLDLHQGCQVYENVFGQESRSEFDSLFLNQIECIRARLPFY